MISGHCGILFNEKADKVAKSGLKASEDSIIYESIPRKRLEHFNRNLNKKRFKEYLKDNVKQSHWQTYPKRDYFLKPRPYTRNMERKIDIFLFRIRSGHNKLGRHLYNVKMKDCDKCRMCNTEIEDSYHLLFKCKEILHSDASDLIKSLRKVLGPLTRDEYHSWIYADNDSAKLEQSKFLRALTLLDIEI